MARTIAKPQVNQQQAIKPVRRVSPQFVPPIAPATGIDTGPTVYNDYYQPPISQPIFTPPVAVEPVPTPAPNAIVAEPMPRRRMGTPAPRPENYGPSPDRVWMPENQPPTVDPRFRRETGEGDIALPDPRTTPPASPITPNLTKPQQPNLLPPVSPVQPNLITPQQPLPVPGPNVGVDTTAAPVDIQQPQPVYIEAPMPLPVDQGPIGTQIIRPQADPVGTITPELPPTLSPISPPVVAQETFSPPTLTETATAEPIQIQQPAPATEQPIVPETATDAAIGEAGVGQQTTEAILVSNLEKARNILRPENVAKDGAIGQQVTDKESKLAEFKSLVDAGNAKAAAALEKEKAALAGDKKEAIYMGLLEIGLVIMGGAAPNAFVNIGKGAKAAFPSLAKSLQDVKDARRRVTDSEIKLAELENTRKIDLAKFDLDLYEKEQTRLANQQNAFLNAQVTLARALTEKDTREKVARLQVQGQKYAADKRASIEGATVQEIQRYADAKGIPYNQAADEVYRLKKSTNRADMISAFLQRGQTNQDGSVTLNKNVIQDFSQFGLEPTRPNT